MSRRPRVKKRTGDWRSTSGRGVVHLPASEYKLHLSDAFRTIDNDRTEVLLRVGEGKTFNFIKLAGTIQDPPPSLPKQLKSKFSPFLLFHFVSVVLRSIQNKRKGISRPPGSFLSSVAEFVFSKKTVELVVTPIISDMQVEYFEALATTRRIKAAWVRLRGYWSLFKALGLYSILKMFVDAWRKISSV